MQRWLRFKVLALLCLCGLITAEVSMSAGAAEGIPLTLAQANPTPVALPSNVKKAGRLYVVESVVVLALFGGAVYAVCRTSRRT